MPRKTPLPKGTTVYQYDGAIHRINMEHKFTVVSDPNNDETIRLSDAYMVADYTTAFFFTAEEAEKLSLKLKEVRNKKGEYEIATSALHHAMTRVKRGMDL